MGSFGWWVAAAAVLLFWSVGAYNRLVRLRAEANTAFTVMDSHWQRQIALIHETLAPSRLVPPAQPMDDVTQLWAALEGATAQLVAALAAMRPKPLHAESAAALGAAQSVLMSAWQRVQHDAHDLAGASMPDTIEMQWQQLTADTDKAQAQFNDAVTRYNAAISQFPAVLLAWLFGFKAAGTA